VAVALIATAPARRGLRQGAVYAAAPVFWIPEDLRISRPHGSVDWSAMRGEDWRTVANRFRVGDHVELVLARAKARPVVVASHDRDLRARRTVRVVPVYSYNQGTFAERERRRIEAGEVPPLLHINAVGTLREGYVDLHQATTVPRVFLDDADHVADLDDLSLATLLHHYATYIAA